MAAYLGEILAGQAHAEVIGPLRDATGASGVIVRSGHLIAEWGDPSAVEMSFSVTKSYLSLLTGVAVDGGLIADLHEPVSVRVNDDAFEDPRNRRITWEHLLHQTSEWSGSLWSKPYWADPQGTKPARRRWGSQELSGRTTTSV